MHFPVGVHPESGRPQEDTHGRAFTREEFIEIESLKSGLRIALSVILRD